MNEQIKQIAERLAGLRMHWKSRLKKWPRFVT